MSRLFVVNNPRNWPLHVPGVEVVSARSYLTGTGRVAVTFWAMVVANVANLGFDVLFVFGLGPVPAMGVKGAAIATVLCTWLQLGVLLFGFGPTPEGTQRRFDRVEVLRALRIGTPIGLHFIVESGVFSLTGALAGRLGEAAAAAHQVALNFAAFMFMMPLSISSATTIHVGHTIGRGDVARDPPEEVLGGFEEAAGVVAEEVALLEDAAGVGGEGRVEGGARQARQGLAGCKARECMREA